MENINALRQEKIDLRGEAQAILNRVERQGRRITAVERQTLGSIESRMSQVNIDIAAREGEIAADINPTAKLAAHHGGNNTGAKVYAKLSDQLLANGFKPTQKSDSLAPFASFHEQLRAVFNAGSNGMNVDPRLAEIQAALGGNEAVPAEGGFLVVPEYAQGLIQRTYDVALISESASRCR